VIYAAKILASGQLPLAKATLFTAQADSVIKSVFLVNTNVANAGVNIYLKKLGSTERRIIPMNMVLGTRFQWETIPEFSMEAEDTIEGDSTVISVDYSIVGGIVP